MKTAFSIAREQEAEMDRLDALALRRPLTNREADRLAELAFIAQRRGFRIRYRAPARKHAA